MHADVDLHFPAVVREGSVIGSAAGDAADDLGLIGNHMLTF